MGHKNLGKVPMPRVMSMAKEATRLDNKAMSVAYC